MDGPAPKVIPGTTCTLCPLRRLEAFRPNTPDEVAFIQQLKVGELAMRARADIVTQGTPSDRLYTVLSGWAFRHKTLPDGRRQILNFLLPGDLLGLQAKLFDAADHGIEALTDVVLCVFSRQRLWEVFHEHPQIAFDITWLGAREEAFVDDGLLSAGRRTARERMAALLLQLHDRARRIGLMQPEGAISLPLTQAHIADALGLSQVHVNRTLKALRTAGLLTLSAGVLRIGDPSRLARLARWEQPVESARPLI